MWLAGIDLCRPDASTSTKPSGPIRAPGHNVPLIRFLVLALYIYILFACLYRIFPHLSFFLHFFLTHLLLYLSFPLRIDPLHFQVGCRKRWLNLALFFCAVVHFFWLANVCFCGVRFSFFSMPSQEICFGKRVQNDLFCVEWAGQLFNQSTKPSVLKLRANCTVFWSLSGQISGYNTHTRLTAFFPGLPGWAGTRKVKPVWILLKQETVSGSGISWAICKSAPGSRQITMPAPHRSVFFTGRMPFLPPNQQRQSTEGKCEFNNGWQTAT